MPSTATPPKRAAALPPDERRSAIVAATLPLLIEHGEMVTTRQIADAAGIAEGTIFRVFADKDAVIAAAVDAALDTGPLEEHLRAIDPGAVVRALAARRGRDPPAARRRHLAASRRASAPASTTRPAGRWSKSTRSSPCSRPSGTKLRVEPVVAARHLRTLTLSATHPMMVGEPMAPAEIVALFLHGVAKGRRQSC